MDYLPDSNRTVLILGGLTTLIVCHALFHRWVSLVSKVPGPPSPSWLYGKLQVSLYARMSHSYPRISIGNLPLLLQREVGEVGTILILQDNHLYLHPNLNRSV
jgi:hypothetical protein